MTASPSPTFEIDDDAIGWIRFDDPDRSMNVLSEPVMKRFAETIHEVQLAAREARVRAVVIVGKPNSFIAGADINIMRMGRHRIGEKEHGLQFAMRNH